MAHFKTSSFQLKGPVSLSTLNCTMEIRSCIFVLIKKLYPDVPGHVKISEKN